MRKNHFLSNLRFMLLLNILVKPVWVLLIDKNVQLAVGHQTYGLYNALMSLTIILNILLDIGITNYNSKTIASNVKQFSVVFPNLFMAKCLLLIIYITSIVLVGIIMGYKSHELRILLLLAGVQFLNSLLQFLRSNIAAHHHFVTDSILSVLDKLLLIILGSVFLFHPFIRKYFTIEWIIYAQLFTYAVSIGYALYYIFSHYGLLLWGKFSLQEMVQLCKRSIPYALLILCMGMYMRSDTLILERMAGANQNGMYAAANRLLDVANMFGFLFAGMLLPMFSRLLSNKGQLSIIIKTSINILLPTSCWVAVIACFYQNEIIQWLYHHHAYPVPNIFAWVMASFPAYCIMYVYSTLLTANGNIGLLIKIAGIGCLFSVLGNVLIIPSHQSLGVSVIAFGVEWLMAGLYAFFATRMFALQIDRNWILKLVSIPVLFILIQIGFQYLHVHWMFAVVIDGFLLLAMVYGMKIWDIQSIKLMLQQKTLQR